MLDYYLLAVDKIHDDLKNSFNFLPEDNYLRSEYVFRKRRYSTINSSDGSENYTWEDNPGTFMQVKEINKHVGGVHRYYEPLESVAKHFFIQAIFPLALQQLPKKKYQVGVHQMRVTGNQDYMGRPAPEGVHQDGFDFVMVTMVADSNMAGGNSLLLDVVSHKTILYDRILSPGDCLLFNDRAFTHYVSPIVPKIPGNCFRDVIVTTFLMKD